MSRRKGVIVSEFRPAALRTLRETLGLTQSQLAAMVGTSGQQVSHWERGRHAMRRDTLNSIAEALGVPDFVLFMEPDE
jgi:transcriptional regulator with XRE-family HTH domain